MQKNDAQQLVLLKGDSAIDGIGEQFVANAFYGGPILCLPVNAILRSDFTPDHSRSFSSGKGDGNYGMDWDNSLPKISRITSKGLPYRKWGLTNVYKFYFERR
jgi:hypothetical protein